MGIGVILPGLIEVGDDVLHRLDCRDGFLGAFWRRPERYLDAGVRAGISTLARLEGRLNDGLARLAADLDSGQWRRQHADLLELDELDLGYRLVIAVS